MSSRIWAFALALGLVSPCFAQGQQDQSAEAREPQRASAGEVAPSTPFSFSVPVRIVEDNEEATSRESKEAIERQLQEQDLEAQRGMNEATQSIERYTRFMFWATLGNVFLVGIGTILLIRNLALLREANELIRQDQRAWIVFEIEWKANFLGRDAENNIQLVFNFSAVNKGKSVATNTTTVQMLVRDAPTRVTAQGISYNSATLREKFAEPSASLFERARIVMQRDGGRVLLPGDKMSHQTYVSPDRDSIRNPADDESASAWFLLVCVAYNTPPGKVFAYDLRVFHVTENTGTLKEIEALRSLK
jgi:hypothetical protein